MKKIILPLILSLFTCAFAQEKDLKTIENHMNESLKPLVKLLEGKKGKVVIGSIKSTDAKESCKPNTSLNAKFAAAVARTGLPSTVSKRPIQMDADQAEIARVVKLSGGSYVVLGSYDVVGGQFKLDCALFDHNGSSLGACDDSTPAPVSKEMAEKLTCPKEEPKAIVTPQPSKQSDTVDPKIKNIDDYICSVIHRDYDFKRLISAIYDKKLMTLDELKKVEKISTEDALEQTKEYCVTLGNFVVCTDYWNGNGAHVFLSDNTGLGSTKIKTWKHPFKEQVAGHERCLQKENNWWQ
jgi:hypothetical protein